MASTVRRRAKVGVSPLFVIILFGGVSWLTVLTSTNESEGLPALTNRVNSSELESMRHTLDVVLRQMHGELSRSEEQPIRPDQGHPSSEEGARNKCVIESGVDFADDGPDLPILENTNAEACCAACASAPLCAAAVLSSEFDSPRRACWLKFSADRRIKKAGVVAFTLQESVVTKAETTGMCQFYPNLDASSDPEDVIFEENSTPERCCAACVAEPSCGMAVLSAATDVPATACWLKRQREPTQRKVGVVSCVPQEGAAFEAAKAALAARRLFSLSAPFAKPPLTAEELASRRAAIRDAVAHCWHAYRERAWGQDSIAPVSGRGVSSGFAAAVTLVDALDTLKLVGLHTEFKEARDYVASSDFGNKLRALGGSTSVFETTIRLLGGLLGAYTLSQDNVFLERAKELGAKIDARISDTGLVPPSFSASVRSGCISLAHSGTTQLELSYLAQLTHDASISRKALGFYNTVRSYPKLEPGLYPQCVGASSGKITLGAESDSFYEYLLKVWLLRRSQEPLDDWLWQAYNAAVDGVDSKLVATTADHVFLDNLDWRGGSVFSRDPAMEHLTCFVGGWLALGSVHQTDRDRADRHLGLADQIASTCWHFYDTQPTKIGPERVKKRQLDLSATDTREYILRPEAAETWWYMFRIRTDANPHLNFDQYRDWGWQAFEAIDNNLRVHFGHASIRDVTKPSSGSNLIDRMESFWIAETLKYFFLLQDDTANGGLLPLDSYVFNTEAHPFAILGDRRTPVLQPDLTR